MQTSEQQIVYLWQRYLAKEASVEELDTLVTLLKNDDFIDSHLDSIRDTLGTADRMPIIKEEWTPIINNIVNLSNPVNRVHRIHFLRTAWFRYAAAVLLVAGTFAYFLLQNTNQPTPIVAANTINEVEPIYAGRKKPELRLADGSIIILDSTAQDDLGNQGNSRMIKLANGKLVYQPLSGSNRPVAWNTVLTPRGGQYQVVLSDGTKVHLNTESSLRFPTSFTDSIREVSVSGEAYFEIAPNSRQPFMIKVDEKAEIQVLGTSLNINAYYDETVVRTTLIEGSIKVKGRQKHTDPFTQSVLLKPTEEWSLRNKVADVKNVDVQSTIAWTHGMFNFKSADLQVVLRQLARWYDVDIKYKDEINERLSGSMYRSESLQELLKIIEFTSKVKFTIDNKTVIVSKK